MKKNQKVPIISDPQQWLDDAYQENLPWCKNYVLNNSGSIEEAKDIFQESLSIAWLNLRQGKFIGDENNFQAYLRKICQYKWMDELKRKSKFSSFDPAQIDLTDEELIPENEKLLNWLSLCMDVLQDRCKKVLSLFYFKGEKLSEIAEEIQVNTESAKTIKYRCMMRLREAYLKLEKENEKV